MSKLTSQRRGGETLANTAPVVSEGDDITVEFSDSIRLTGEVSDDGYPNNTLTYQWEVVSSPEESNVAFTTQNKVITKITVDKTGTYEFKLTVSDRALSSSDTVMVVVQEEPALLETVAKYSFDQTDTVHKNVLDESGSENDVKLVGSPTVVEGFEGSGDFRNWQNISS